MLRKLLKATVGTLYAVVAVIITLFTGCASLMPTRVPPLTAELGYDVPDYKGWTVVGLNDGAYRMEVEKLKVWKVMIGLVNDPALALHGQAVNWLNMALAGGALGGIPLALKRVPPGYTKKEE
jgi:hypothetical protein